MCGFQSANYAILEATFVWGALQNDASTEEVGSYNTLPHVSCLQVLTICTVHFGLQNKTSQIMWWYLESPSSLLYT